MKFKVYVCEHHETCQADCIFRLDQPDRRNEPLNCDYLGCEVRMIEKEIDIPYDYPPRIPGGALFVGHQVFSGGIKT